MAAKVEIGSIDYNPPGWDVVDADEHVLIVNKGDAAATLTGWTLRDARVHVRRPFVYTFPSFVLDAGREVKVWTGEGVDDAGNLHWGRESAVWNNDGDTAVLTDATSHEISRYSYPPRPPRPPPLVVMAWNIGEAIGLNGDEQVSLDCLVANLSSLNADIVLLNEACLNWNGHFNQPLYVAQHAGYQYVEAVITSHKFPDVRREKRVAVLSHTPLSFIERIEHSAYADGKGFATLHVSTPIRGRTHHVFSTRLNAGDGGENARSCAQLRDRINALSPQDVVIIGGDFNSGYGRFDDLGLPTRHEVPAGYADFVRGTRLQHVLGGLGWEPFSTDDQLLFRGPYRASSAVRFAPTPNPSDHPYVAATLTPVEVFATTTLDNGRLLATAPGRPAAVVFGGAPFAVPDEATWQRLYTGNGPVEVVSPELLAHLPEVPCDGTVLREEGSGETWGVGAGVRHRMASSRALVAHGGADVVRTVPTGTLAAIPIAEDDEALPPESWAEYWRWTGGGSTLTPSASNQDRIDYAVVEGAPGVPSDAVLFVLLLDAALGWDKELVFVNDDPLLGQIVTTLRVKPISRSASQLVTVTTLGTTHLLLRKDRFVTGMLEIAQLHSLDRLPAGCSVTFTWMKD